MSVWGTGPFEDDASVDFRDELLERLTGRIDAEMESRFRSMTSLYIVHSVAAVVLHLCRLFGGAGALTKSHVEQWIAAAQAIEQRARSSGELESMDEELMGKLTDKLQQLAGICVYD